MKLYGNVIAPTTRMVLTTLAEKGHTAEYVDIDFSKGEQRRPEHLARHPFGVTPVLEDDGFLIHEARAILRYIDRRLPTPPLSPSDAQSFGRMEQLIGVEQAYLSPNVMPMVYARFRPVDPAAIEKAKTELVRVLDVANKALAGRPYMAGDDFTLADIVWMPYTGFLFEVGQESSVTSRPSYRAWWERVSARPSWAKSASR